MHFFFANKLIHSRVQVRAQSSWLRVRHQITSWLIYDRWENKELFNRLEHRSRHRWTLQVRSRVANDHWILEQGWVWVKLELLYIRTAGGCVCRLVPVRDCLVGFCYSGLKDLVHFCSLIRFLPSLPKQCDRCILSLDGRCPILHPLTVCAGVPWGDRKFIITTGAIW